MYLYEGYPSAIRARRLKFRIFTVSWLEHAAGNQSITYSQPRLVHSTEDALRTSSCECQCGFFKAIQLPCRHIFWFCQFQKVQSFDEILCATRWTWKYYHEFHRVFSCDPIKEMDLTVSISQPKPLKILSKHEKYRKSLAIALKIASLASEIPMREYNYAMDCLQQNSFSLGSGKVCCYSGCWPAFCSNMWFTYKMRCCINWQCCGRHTK